MLGYKNKTLLSVNNSLHQGAPCQPLSEPVSAVQRPSPPSLLFSSLPSKVSHWHCGLKFPCWFLSAPYPSQAFPLIKSLKTSGVCFTKDPDRQTLTDKLCTTCRKSMLLEKGRERWLSTTSPTSPNHFLWGKQKCVMLYKALNSRKFGFFFLLSFFFKTRRIDAKWIKTGSQKTQVNPIKVWISSQDHIWMIQNTHIKLSSLEEYVCFQLSKSSGKTKEW